MPRPPVRPPQLAGRVFRGSAVVRAGLLTRSQLRTSAWRRVFPDVHACTTARIDHAVRALAVSRLLLPGAVVSGRRAAVLWGVDLADADDDVTCTVAAPVRAGAVAGVALTRRDLRTEETTTRRGTRVTTPLRTVLDLARTRPLDDAVVDVDRFLRSGLVDLGSAREAAGTLTGRDCRHVRRVLALSDGLAESPQETRLRLLLLRSGLPRPVAQHVVRDGPRFVARVDLAWPGQRIAVEYDGAWHADPAQLRADRARLNRLTAAGWRVVFVTAADLHRPEVLLARLRALLASPRPA
ncbi:endonuclease domain-containing protein [Geodermatophilus sp. SYSU D01180]